MEKMKAKVGFKFRNNEIKAIRNGTKIGLEEGPTQGRDCVRGA